MTEVSKRMGPTEEGERMAAIPNKLQQKLVNTSDDTRYKGVFLTNGRTMKAPMLKNPRTKEQTKA